MSSTDWGALVVELDRSCEHARIRADASLGPFTTYRVGGAARVLVEVGSTDDLEAVGERARAHEVAAIVIGRGSNLLVADRGFDGIAIVLGEQFAQERFDGQTVAAGAAVALPALARKTVAQALTGFEWAVGVPGSVGGAVRMNAGGHGADMAASVTSAQVYDLESGELRRWSATELDFGYRHSAIESCHVVVEATLELDHGDEAASAAQVREIVAWRRANQPGGQNAGSVFRNPDGVSAGELIDRAGLKGFRVGSAQVSDKHANFIQASPDGSADDVLALMREIQRRVVEAEGIHLHPETVLVGFPPVDPDDSPNTSDCT